MTENKKRIVPEWAKKLISDDIKEKTRCKILENIQKIELFKLSNRTSSRDIIINLRAENIQLQKSLRELERIQF